MMNPSEIGSAASAQIKAAEDASEHVVKAHPELYHYTGAAGLRGSLRPILFGLPISPT
jgi:hypothetical protein